MREVSNMGLSTGWGCRWPACLTAARCPSSICSPVQPAAGAAGRRRPPAARGRQVRAGERAREIAIDGVLALAAVAARPGTFAPGLLQPPLLTRLAACPLHGVQAMRLVGSIWAPGEWAVETVRGTGKGLSPSASIALPRGFNNPACLVLQVEEAHDALRLVGAWGG